MSDEKFYDYLILGGEHDRLVVNGPYNSIIEVQVRNTKRMAKSYAPNVPADVNRPEVVAYKVIEHTHGDGRHFFIASNEDLTNVDIEQAILESGISPIR